MNWLISWVIQRNTICVSRLAAPALATGRCNSKGIRKKGADRWMAELFFQIKTLALSWDHSVHWHQDAKTKEKKRKFMLHIEVRRVYKRSHCFGFFIDSVWESNIQSHHLALVSTPVLLVGMDGICYCQNNISQKTTRLKGLIIFKVVNTYQVSYVTIS
jgi:hypothetical protein